MLTGALSASFTTAFMLLVRNSQHHFSWGSLGPAFLVLCAIRFIFDGSLLALVFAPLTSVMRSHSLSARTRYLLPVGASTALGTLLFAKSMPIYPMLWGLVSFGLAATIWTIVDLRSPFRDAFRREQTNSELIAASNATFSGMKIGLIVGLLAIFAPLILLAIVFLVSEKF